MTIPRDWVIPDHWVGLLRDAAGAVDTWGARLHQQITQVDVALPAQWLIEAERLSGPSARPYLANWACSRKYIPPEDEVSRFGVLACSDETLRVAESFNEACENYSDCYAAIRAEAGAQKAEQQASQKAHEALKCTGETNIDFARVRAQLVLMPGEVLDLRYFVSVERKTRRLALSDAIAQLQARKDTYPDAAPYIEAEIRALRERSPATPVAYAKKTAVEALRCMVRWRDEGDVKLSKRSGVNPIFCSNYHEDLELSVPRRVREPGGGRKAVISDEPVSSHLQGWYWYLR